MAGAEPTPLSEADRAAINTFMENWRTACLAADWDAVMAMCADDITFQMPGGPVAGEAVRAWLEAFPKIQSLRLEITHAEGTDRLAVIRGTGEQVLEQDGETISTPGRYCDILRKDDEGAWRMACVNWSPDTV